jgi:hypothetical protein
LVGGLSPEGSFDFPVESCNKAGPTLDVPAAAADHPGGTTGLIDPGMAIIGCSLVTPVPVILHPFRNVSVQMRPLVQSLKFGWKLDSLSTPTRPNRTGEFT